MSIFSSYLLSDGEKAAKVRDAIFPLILAADARLETVFGQQFFQYCISNITQLEFASEIALLDVIELIVERAGIEKQLGILTSVHSSGLHDRIKKMLRMRVLTEEDQLRTIESYSSITEQLGRCYLWTVRFEIVEDIEGKLVIAKVLKNGINMLIGKLISVSKMALESNDNQQKDEELESQIQNNSKLLRAFRFTIQCINNNRFFVQLKLHESIASLIHLNCAIHQKCSQMIVLHSSISALDELRASALSVLGQFAMSYQDVRQYLIKYHDIVQHISDLVIPLALSDISNENKTFEGQSNQICSSTIVAADSFELLQSFFIQNPPIIDDSVFKSDLIPMIISLSRFKRSKLEGDDILTSAKIRRSSLECLHMIQQHQNIDIVQKLIQKLDYIKTLIKVVGIAGGSLEENVQVIFWGLLNIEDLFNVLRLGDKEKICQPVLHEAVKEMLELEGGEEETDANMFSYDGIRNPAVGAMNELRNCYMNLTNRDDEEEDMD